MRLCIMIRNAGELQAGICQSVGTKPIIIIIIITTVIR